MTIETIVFLILAFALGGLIGFSGFLVGFYSCRANFEKFWNSKLKK